MRHDERSYLKSDSNPVLSRRIFHNPSRSIQKPNSTIGFVSSNCVRAIAKPETPVPPHVHRQRTSRSSRRQSSPGTISTVQTIPFKYQSPQLASFRQIPRSDGRTGHTAFRPHRYFLDIANKLVEDPVILDL
jgi:hypothetical protein